jgi:hypothetical protein
MTGSDANFIIERGFYLTELGDFQAARTFRNRGPKSDPLRPKSRLVIKPIELGYMNLS